MSVCLIWIEEYIRKFEDDEDDYRYEEVPVEDFYENGNKNRINNFLFSSNHFWFFVLFLFF